MSRASPKIRAFAKRLIADETHGKSLDAKSAAALLVCDKLRPHLATLMGSIGFRSLVLRALTLASAEVPTLSRMAVGDGGFLTDLDKPELAADPKAMAEGGAILIAEVLGLMVAFIGEYLTLRTLGEVWPKLSPHELNFG